MWRCKHAGVASAAPRLHLSRTLQHATQPSHERPQREQAHLISTSMPIRWSTTPASRPSRTAPPEGPSARANTPRCAGGGAVMKLEAGVEWQPCQEARWHAITQRSREQAPPLDAPMHTDNRRCCSPPRGAGCAEASCVPPPHQVQALRVAVAQLVREVAHHQGQQAGAGGGHQRQHLRAGRGERAE